jgi:4'-phosphopantetheinyl transferase
MLTDIYSFQLNRESHSSTVVLCLAQATLTELEASSPSWLHKKEQAVAKTLTGQKESYLLGRYCAKKALQKLIPTAHQDIWIGAGVFGQPILDGKINKTAQVAIAHNANLGAALIFDEAQPMGIDLERNIEDHSRIIKLELTSLEKKLLTTHWNLSYSIHPHPWIWTIKEALSKTLKTGLTVPLSLYEINEIGKEDNFIYASYKNFPQYKALSSLWNDAIITMVLPKKTNANFH